MSKIEIKPSHIVNIFLSIVLSMLYFNGLCVDKPIYEYTFLDHASCFIFYSISSVSVLLLLAFLGAAATGEFDQNTIKINNPFAKSKIDEVHEQLGKAYMDGDKVKIAELEKELDKLNND